MDRRQFCGYTRGSGLAAAIIFFVCFVPPVFAASEVYTSVPAVSLSGAHIEIERDATAAGSYGPACQRLAKIKGEYDPGNLFGGTAILCRYSACNLASKEV